MKPRLAITMGDVNGIGPEILAKALARRELYDVCQPVVIGSAAALNMARDLAPACPEAKVVDDNAWRDGSPDIVPVLEGAANIPPLEPGVLDAAAGKCAVEWIAMAVKLAVAGEVDGMVTCPINKEGIHLAGCRFAGHTDFIADMTKAHDYRMCLFAGPMRIVHISSHCALSEALGMVKAGRIADSIRIAADALARLDLPRRRIAVAALNPHAGEAGAFGREEIEEIGPAVETCRAEGIDCCGPFSADTIFLRMKQGEFDLVVAMYHDQGHIPLKLIAMDEGVNVTLGIPIVRTSVDHGTAYDIAGKGIAREESLCAAIALAAELGK